MIILSIIPTYEARFKLFQEAEIQSARSAMWLKNKGFTEASGGKDEG